MARILVIDDEPALRELIQRWLESDGHEVIAAANGDAGLELFRSARPDMVITDVFMPERDGIEILRSVAGEAAPTPILVMSGGGVWPREAEHLLDVTRHLGATRTLQKPFRPADLLRVVAEMLAPTRPRAP